MSNNGAVAKQVTLHEIQLDDKRIAYSSVTFFRVQIGKGKGAYKTRYSFMGNPCRAYLYYCGLNIGNGYKKRLIMDGSSKPIFVLKYL